MEDAANNAEVVSQRRNDNATVPNLNSVEDPAKVLHLINNPVTLKDVEWTETGHLTVLTENVRQNVEEGSKNVSDTVTVLHLRSEEITVEDTRRLSVFVTWTHAKVGHRGDAGARVRCHAEVAFASASETVTRTHVRDHNRKSEFAECKSVAENKHFRCRFRLIFIKQIFNTSIVSFIKGIIYFFK